MPTPIQVGIIGYGSSVKNYHLPYILSCPEMLHLRAILQRSAPPTDGASGHVAVDHPELTHYRTTDSFFADKEIEHTSRVPHRASASRYQCRKTWYADSATLAAVAS
jgi:predicted dehydrogenase